MSEGDKGGPLEVLILGGGPAGCAAALSLLGRGIAPEAIAVAEASGYERERIGESIPPDSSQLLAELGLLDGFLAEGHEPCLGSASSWGADELGYNDFMFNPYGKGWHLDRRRFDAWLADQVEARGVAVWRGVKFLDLVEHGEGGAVLALGSARGEGEVRQVRARVVVDATGARSLYAKRMGARRRALDLLVSVAAFFGLPEGSDFAKLTFLEAVEYGWWYTARLPGRRIATAVATSHEIYKQRRFDRAPAWLQALSETRHLAGVLAECEPIPDSFSVCTAPSFVLDRIYGDHWLAVGDAASAYDPISSQGIYKALQDGLHAGSAIAARLDSGSLDPFAEHQRQVEARFADYARQRAYFYELERRWEDAEFWRGRRDRSLD